jgi:hypothetical protein
VSQFTQQQNIDVGDVPKHIMRVFEVHRIYPDTPLDRRREARRGMESNIQSAIERAPQQSTCRATLLDGMSASRL